MNFIDLINATANDVHPPLYYIILRISSLVFGFYPSLYHLVSVVPYIIVVLFSISFIRKKIGNWGTLIFISIISLSEQAVKYNVEVRMYSLAATFVLFSFYSLLKIIETGKGYVCFIITALAAAYTHYYALLSVSFFYLAILFYAFSKKEFISILLVCIFSILLYVPWLAHFLSAYQRTSNGFWITAFPSVIDSFFYFFGESKRWYTILMLLITIYPVLEFLYNKIHNILTKYSCFDGRTNLRSFFSYIFLHNSSSVFFSCSIYGIFAGFGTIFVAELVCYLVRPLFILRYLYPLTAVILLVCCINISKYKIIFLFSPLILILTLFTYIPEYKSVYRSDKFIYSQTDNTINIIKSYVDNNDEFITNESHFSWNVLEYYFKNSKVKLITSGQFNLNRSQFNKWLFWIDNLSSEEIDNLRSNGFIAKKIVNDANLDCYKFKFYKLEYVE